MPYAAESIVVTAAREAKKIWPFLTGMGVVGFAVVKVTAAATPEVRRPSSRLPAGLRAWLAMLLCATAARWLWACSAEFRFWRACAPASPAEAHLVLLGVCRTSRSPSSPTPTSTERGEACGAQRTHDATRCSALLRGAARLCACRLDIQLLSTCVAAWLCPTRAAVSPPAANGCTPQLAGAGKVAWRHLSGGQSRSKHL